MGQTVVIVFTRIEISQRGHVDETAEVVTDRLQRPESQVFFRGLDMQLGHSEHGIR